MDHLPWHGGDLLTRPKVPLLCLQTLEDIPNDIDDFASWPARRNWDFQKDDMSIEEHARRTQAWLFFGTIRLLQQHVGKHFDIRDFVSSSDETLIDSTKVVEVLPADALAYDDIDQQIRAEDSTQDLARKALIGVAEVLCDSFQDNLLACFTFVNRVDIKAVSSDPWSSLEYNVVWSTILLFERLFWWTKSVCKLDEKVISNLESIIFALCNDNTYLTRGILAGGRCPTLVRSTNWLWTATSFFALMANPVPPMFSHTECTGSYCAAFNHCTMKHIGTCRDPACQLVNISESDLGETIGKGSIPLVQSTLRNGILSINIVGHERHTSYTAISHVWAGGLGNTTGNAHYACQLLEIHSDIIERKHLRRHTSDSTVYYWLDTLCIPFEDIALKRQAIDSMANIYAGACQVLVIDPDLTTINRENLTLGELSAVVWCSPWMFRSWTLQEGALALNLKFRFKDRLVSMLDTHVSPQQQSLSSHIQSLWRRDVDRFPLPEIMDSFADVGNAFFLTDLRESNTMTQEKLQTAWNALAYRTTTQNEDIAAILAVYLDCSAGEVLALPQSHRMQALLRTQAKLPTALLFVPSADAAGWSPRMPDGRENKHTLSTTSGYMSFTASHELRIPHAESFKIIVVSEMFELGGTVVVYDTLESTCYHLQFSNVLDHNNASPFLFVFDSLSAESGRAVAFKDVVDDASGLHAKFIGALTYRRHGERNECRPARVDLQSGPSRSRNQLTRVQVTNPINQGYITPSHPLILDIGAQSWPQLQWSRPDFYPFVETSFQNTQLLNVLLPLTIVGCAYLFLYLLIGSFAISLYLKQFKEAAAYLLIAGPIVFGRAHLGTIEYRYLRGLCQENLQRAWAVSFQPVLQGDAANQFIWRWQDHATLIGFYAVLLIVSSTASIGFALNYFKRVTISGFNYEAFGEVTQLVITSRFLSAPMGIIKPICFMTWLELVTRMVLVTGARAAYARRPRRQSHDRIDPNDRTYFLAIYCLQIIAFVLILPYTLYMWLALIRDSSKDSVPIYALKCIIMIAGSLVTAFLLAPQFSKACLLYLRRKLQLLWANTREKLYELMMGIRLHTFGFRAAHGPVHLT